MAVYTSINTLVAQPLIYRLGLGTITKLEGITAGIENTNYFIDTHIGKYVLTLFERLKKEELPYYLGFMQHLAEHGIHVPKPQANGTGEILHSLRDKPCVVVNKLPGKSVNQPEPKHCDQVGQMLAKMHLAGQSFSLRQTHLRGLLWWNETVPVVLPFLDSDEQVILSQELQYQNTIAQSREYQTLPRGPIHADLFRNNVLFEHRKEGLQCAFFDFYFAGDDSWLFDIAVCLNDWCLHPHQTHSKVSIHLENQQAFLQAYTGIRPLLKTELNLLPAILRGAAFRFWLSRLWDWYLPRKASQLKPHDPKYFKQVLQLRQIQSVNLPIEDKD
jgi:homoserine kinase type II